MNKLPQIIKRKIGTVDILDLHGEFVGPWALRGREEIAQFIKNHDAKNLLINLRGLSTVDSLGVKAVIDNLSQPGLRSGLIIGNLSVMEMFSRVMPLLKDLKLFKNEEEIIHYFGEDLVKWGDSATFEEKRKFPRLKTALQLEFSYEVEKDRTICFNAVVTDLSEGGLYAEYLDLDQSSLGKWKVNPFDFRILHLKIKFPPNHELIAEGKVMRTVLEGVQVGIGIEFCRLSEESKLMINNFLK